MHNMAQRWAGLSICDIPCGALVVNVASIACGKVCEFSDDHWHHADESGFLKVTEGSDGTYGVRAKCKYCNKEFVATDLTVDDFSSNYNDYVSTLPASGYDSAGKLLWQPRWIEDTYSWGLYLCDSDSSNVYYGVRYSIDGYYASFPGKFSVSYDGPSFHFKVFSYCPPSLMFTEPNWHSFKCPIDGYYKSLGTPFLSGVVGYDSGYKDLSQYNYNWNKLTTYRSAGSSISTDTSTLLSNSVFDSRNPFIIKFNYVVSGSFSITTPVFEITPLSTDTTISNTYNINTRVNNFQGDYYDSVTNNYYNNTTIINETTNNYYDMTTNNYYTMSNWSYDYQSRTYFVTLEDGTTITVQFGDDCLTITNNNVEHSYQYVINNNNTPSPNPETPSTCKHNWTETIDVAPTCLEGGHANFTCSLCGETYEQILSAKGHNWTVADHVNTVYGDNGEIVTQGHTLYECSTCGEQWYTETAAPPPDVSGGTNILAWLQSFQTWLGVQLELVIDKIQVTINNTETNIENVTNVVIEETNNAYNVFYVTTEDGNEKPIGEVAGDTLSASGKLLNFLYKLCFEGALSKVDDSITDMDGFYFDNGAGLEGNIWD